MIDKQMKNEGGLFDGKPLQARDTKDRVITTLVDDLSRLVRYESVDQVPGLVFDCIYQNAERWATKEDLFDGAQFAASCATGLDPKARRQAFTSQLRIYARRILKSPEDSA